MYRVLAARARSGLAAIADPAPGVLPAAVVSACATPDNEPRAIQRQLVQKSRALAKRMTATGGGSRETVIGNGRDDASDAPDRRVEQKVVDA